MLRQTNIVMFSVPHLLNITPWPPAASDRVYFDCQSLVQTSHGHVRNWTHDFLQGMSWISINWMWQVRPSILMSSKKMIWRESILKNNLTASEYLDKESSVFNFSKSSASNDAWEPFEVDQVLPDELQKLIQKMKLTWQISVTWMIMPFKL